jgi:hypothetical protein
MEAPKASKWSDMPTSQTNIPMAPYTLASSSLVLADTRRVRNTANSRFSTPSHPSGVASGLRTCGTRRIQARLDHHILPPCQPPLSDVLPPPILPSLRETHACRRDLSTVLRTKETCRTMGVVQGMDGCSQTFQPWLCHLGNLTSRSVMMRHGRHRSIVHARPEARIPRQIQHNFIFSPRRGQRQRRPEDNN